MRIVSSTKINFLINNIFEKYYEPIQKELVDSGLIDDLAHKIIQEILAMIYRRAMDEGIETEEELDVMAVEIINEQLELVLVSYYVQKYIDRFSLDKVALVNNMLNRMQDVKNKRINEKPIEKPIQKPIEESVESVIIRETRENSIEQEQSEFVESEIDTAENIENQYLYNDFDSLEILDLEDERKESRIVRRMEEPHIIRFQINWMLTIFASLLVTIVLWFVVGILMARGYLPRVDLGYTWFNTHIGGVF